MERKQFTYIVIAILIVVFIWNPFSKKSSSQKIPPPRVDRELAESMSEYVQSHYKSPEDYIVDAFRTRDIIFLGESSKIKEHVELVQNLIPKLYEAGITTLGIEYVLYDDQEKIDKIVTSRYYDEKKVRELFLAQIGNWGFQEYADIFKAAWKLNNALSSDEKPFRVLGLSVKQNLKIVTSEKDMNDPDIKKQIWALGFPNTFMAKTILKEIIDKREKALIFCQLNNAFTRYRYKQYAENAEKEGFSELRAVGNIVYDRIGSRAGTVFLHFFWPDSKSMYGISYSVDGVMDATISILPEERIRAGFDTLGNPISDVVLKDGDFVRDYKDLTVKDLFDGYVILGPLFEYTAVTPIPDLFDEHNMQEVIVNFPFITERIPSEDLAKAAQKLNEMLASEVQAIEKRLEMFKY
jgi:predicted nucleic acid-binding protein